MNKRSSFFRKLNCLTCGHSRLNCHALRISRALDEACRALPTNRQCRRNRCDRGCDRCDCSRCRRNH